MTKLSYDQIYSLCRSVGCSTTQAITATAIAAAESGLDTRNVGDKTLAKYGSRGLWQVFSGAWSLKDLNIKSYDDLFDPVINTRCMWLISKRGKTWQPWSTYNHGSHKQFMGKASAAASRVQGNWAQYLPGHKVTPTPAPGKKVSLANVIAAAKADPNAAQGHGLHPADVRIVEAALKAEGLLDAAYSADGYFGSKAIAAYRAWQERCHYTGKAADGIPGRDSLTRLGRAHGFTVS